MARRHFETLSAFFDAEPVPAHELLGALRHRGAFEFLEFMARLRLWVREETPTPSRSWCRALRRRLERLEAMRRRAQPSRARSLKAHSSMLRDHDSLVVGRSTRQSEILTCLLAGLSEKEVADRLGLKQTTVHTHVKRLHHKLGVHSRGELLAAVRPPSNPVPS